MDCVPRLVTEQCYLQIVNCARGIVESKLSAACYPGVKWVIILICKHEKKTNIINEDSGASKKMIKIQSEFFL